MSPVSLIGRNDYTPLIPLNGSRNGGIRELAIRAVMTILAILAILEALLRSTTTKVSNEALQRAGF